jgi:nucleotidyltransferase DUF2204
MHSSSVIGARVAHGAERGNDVAVLRPQDLDELIGTLKRGGAALRDAEIPFMLGGSLAAWARGGPAATKDLDLMLRPEDAERALAELERIGMRPERPPEGWLLKAYDDGVLIDLIYDPQDGPVDDDMFARAEEMEVYATRLQVSALEDVLVQKLLALSEQDPDYSSVLELARSLREQVDWDDVRTRTEDSPFAKGYFTLLDELEILPS